MVEGSPAPAAEDVAAVRRFNRFYTQKIGVLEEGLLHSGFTLAEARVLFELASRDGLTASQLCRELGLDQGYLSRILARFRRQGLLRSSAAPGDRRQSILALTEAGHRAFAPLEAATQEQIAALLAGLPAPARAALRDAMQRIESLLGGAAAEPAVLRPPRPGDIGWTIHRQARLYAGEYGWDGSFEALLAEIAARFIRDFDPAFDDCWIADRGGTILGAVFLVRAEGEPAGTTGQLRMLYVEPEARGQGIGARLVEACIRRARELGYRRLILWTNDILVSARRIYQAAGFRLVREEPHHSFGRDLVGQYWELDLATAPAGRPPTVRPVSPSAG